MLTIRVLETSSKRKLTATELCEEDKFFRALALISDSFQLV